VYDIMAEPLLFHHMADKAVVRDRVVEMLENVGLGADFLSKFPHEMSGGQRQRVAIGRALATSPVLVIADEPVSALDVSIQAQIVNLFIDIRERLHISMLFISHDLNIVRFISDNIVVMYGGRILEAGTTDEVFYKPLHPYTRMLIGAIKGDYCKMTGRDAFDAGGGCIYYPRCNIRSSACAKGQPELQGTKEHRVACFLTSV